MPPIRRIDGAVIDPDRAWPEPARARPALPRRASAPVADSDRLFSDGGLRYFPDVSFPATKSDLVASARAHGAPLAVVDALRRIPDRVYPFAKDVLAAAGGDLQR